MRKLKTHGGVHNPIICQVCDKAFAQKAGFVNHMKFIHPSDSETKDQLNLQLVKIEKVCEKTLSQKANPLQ